MNISISTGETWYDQSCSHDIKFYELEKEGFPKADEMHVKSIHKHST